MDGGEIAIITTKVTMTTNDLIHDLSTIIDEMRGNDVPVVLVINEPMKIHDNQCYIRDCIMSMSWMRCFSEIYNYNTLIYRREQ